MDDEKLPQISDERAPGGLVYADTEVLLVAGPKKRWTEDLLGHNVIAHNNNRQWAHKCSVPYHFLDD